MTIFKTFCTSSSASSYYPTTYITNNVLTVNKVDTESKITKKKDEEEKLYFNPADLDL